MNADIESMRPSITSLLDPVEILRAMLEFRRKQDGDFSVLSECKKLYRVSPTLISLILKGQRKISLDRVDGLAKLMQLSGSEKNYFKTLVYQASPLKKSVDLIQRTTQHRSRKNVSHHLLLDWLNPYVKDVFHIEAVQKKPELVYQKLGSIASQTRIRKSLDFLLKEGHLRHTPDGKMVVECNLTVTESPIPSKKIRQFHKAALKVAQQGLDLHLPSERFANTLLINLSPKKYQDLLLLIQDFAEELKTYSEVSEPDCDRLYQVIINVSPTGGKVV